MISRNINFKNELEIDFSIIIYMHINKDILPRYRCILLNLEFIRSNVFLWYLMESLISSRIPIRYIIWRA